MNSRPAENGSAPVAPLCLDLSRHCIETACRRRYNRAVNAFFAHPARGEALAAEIETLCRALEEIDFGALRSRHPALRGGYAGTVLLERRGNRFAVRIDGETVIASPRSG